MEGSKGFHHTAQSYVFDIGISTKMMRLDVMQQSRFFKVTSFRPISVTFSAFVGDLHLVNQKVTLKKLGKNWIARLWIQNYIYMHNILTFLLFRSGKLWKTCFVTLYNM